MAVFLKQVSNSKLYTMYAPLERSTKPQLPPYESAKGKMEWNYQTVTFVLSIIVQAIALGLSVYAFVDAETNPGSKPELLTTILILELVVQGVELTWYAVVGLIYYCGGASIGVEYRYLDWMVTTPTMLISILLFIWYLQCNLLTLENIGSDGSKMLAILTSVVLNWVMLAMGYVYEAKMKSITSMLDSLLGPNSGLYLGFIPFLGSYVPVFASVIAKSDPLAWFVSILTFLIWALYGVVAILYTKPGDDGIKNTFYNLLDIVSKNIAGITVAIVTFMYSKTPLDPTVPLCNVTSS